MPSIQHTHNNTKSDYLSNFISGVLSQIASKTTVLLTSNDSTKLYYKYN